MFVNLNRSMTVVLCCVNVNADKFSAKFLSITYLTKNKYLYFSSAKGEKV